ncbi:hypothetical protein JCM10207_003123 [Rhodosporidiobolus poonsookiae]
MASTASTAAVAAGATANSSSPRQGPRINIPHDLPPEIVSLIVEEVLTLSLGWYTESPNPFPAIRRRLAALISPFGRTWANVASELFWRILDLPKADQLLGHLQQYPHLARYVKELEVNNEEGKQPLSYNGRLLSLVALRKLAMNVLVDDISLIHPRTPEVPLANLSTLDLTLSGGALNPNVLLRTLAALPLLNELYIDLKLEQNVKLHPTHQARQLPLKTLDVSFNFAPNAAEVRTGIRTFGQTARAASSVLRGIFDLLDPAQLQEVDLLGVGSVPSFLEAHPSYPGLHTLRLASYDTADLILRMLSVWPSLPALRIADLWGAVDVTDCSPPTPAGLTRFLNSVPADLKELSLFLEIGDTMTRLARTRHTIVEDFLARRLGMPLESFATMEDWSLDEGGGAGVQHWTKELNEAGEFEWADTLDYCQRVHVLGADREELRLEREREDEDEQP